MDGPAGSRRALGAAVAWPLAIAAIGCSAAAVEPAATVTIAPVAPPVPAPPAPPPPPEEPLPACEVRPALAPAAFVAEGSAGVQLVPAADRGLAEVQTLLEDWVRALGDHTDADCHVVRSDGELLSIFCSSSLFTGNGSVRAGPEESFVFARTADRWRRLSLPDLLPAASPDPRKLLDPLCEASKSGVHPGALELTAQSNGDPWLNVVEPGAGGLHLQVGWGGPGGSAHCVVGYDQLVRPAGCGPLAPLARPVLVAEAASTDALAPLEIVRVEEEHGDGDWHFAHVSSRDPRRQQVVTAIGREMAAWRMAAAASQPFNLACDVTMSTDALVSVLCTSSEGAAGPSQAGLTYRLSDGTRIGPDEVFAANPNALRAATKRCLGERVRKPKDDSEATLDKLPTWTPTQFSAFGLTGDSVRFVVGYEPKTRKGEVKKDRAYCYMRYAELKTTPGALAKPPPTGKR